MLCDLGGSFICNVTRKGKAQELLQLLILVAQSKLGFISQSQHMTSCYAFMHSYSCRAVQIGLFSPLLFSDSCCLCMAVSEVNLSHFVIQLPSSCC